METITVPRIQFKQMEQELLTLRKSTLYKRLLEFEENISRGKKYTREDLGF